MSVERRRESRDPCSLYIISVSVITDNFKILRKDLKYLPANLLFDVYYKLYKENSLCSLGDELSNLQVFTQILKLSICRPTLHKCFQAVEEHGANVAKALSTAYVLAVRKTLGSGDGDVTKEAIIDTGLRLGGFLNDAAWYDKAERVLVACKEVCETLQQTARNQRLLLHCCDKLLRVQAVYCNLAGAEQNFKHCQSLIASLEREPTPLNLASTYSNFSVYFFIRSEFDESYRYSMLALQQLCESLPPNVTVDVLRQASKTCVVKRQFAKAGILVRQAVDLAASVFGVEHPKYADAQLDYGFFLLNFDSIKPCVEVYESAFNIKSSIFSSLNLQVAVALEDLAYALYVYEYSSGRFERAKTLSERAIEIMQKLLPLDHIMMSSAKRVKALILEEIAIDTPENLSEKKLLEDAEELHLIALRLAKKAFGEKNVQTAKHYGNLGRLYQSMKRLEEAEAMHLKAIAIKEELLGPEDYEVGLSVGHLASLYNYHMKRYDKATVFYLRSVAISIKLFGHSYSGLEYDYRGLVHVYSELGDPEKVAEYSYRLNSWKVLREHQLHKGSFTTAHHEPRPLHQVLGLVLDQPGPASGPPGPTTSASV